PDRHPEAARAARDKVLARMQALGRWTPQQVEDAKLEPVVARSLRVPQHAALLAQRLRQQHPRARRLVTTVDANLQRALEERVGAYFASLPPRTSAALLVVDNASLATLAYIGSAAFGDDQRLGHVDMVRAWRSPGSTLKPFLYGMALDQGLIHSESLLVDAPQDFGGYRPGNFGEAFNGPVGAAAVAQRAGSGPAGSGRAGALRRAPGARRPAVAVPARYASGAAAGPGWHLGAAGGPGRRLCGAAARGRRRAGAVPGGRSPRAA